MRNNYRYGSRLNRIERKCDRILSELSALRHRLSHQPDIDSIIDRLHRSAREMRRQCEKECEEVRRMFRPKSTGYEHS